MLVAGRAAETQQARNGGQPLAEHGGVVHQADEAREIAGAAGHGHKRAEQRHVLVGHLRVGRRLLRAQVQLFPHVGEPVIFGIGGRGRELEGRTHRQGLVGRGRHHGGRVAGGRVHGAGGAVDKNPHLLVVACMEGGIGVGLQVVARLANAGVGHDGRARAGLPGGSGPAVAARTAASVAIEGMVATKLVPHLVGHVIDVESIANGASRAGEAAGLVGPAHHTQAGHAAATRSHQVADVVVRRADDGVDSGYVSRQVVAGVGVGVGSSIGVYQQVSVSHQHQAHGQFLFVHAYHAVHGRYDGC